MLASGRRLRRSEDFAFTMRHGVKAGSSTAVIYLARTGDAKGMAGFAVSRAVGGAVMRNLVKRRLRAIVAPELDALGPGACVVVRALPAAASADFDELQGDVLSGLRRVQAKERG